MATLDITITAKSNGETKSKVVSINCAGNVALLQDKLTLIATSGKSQQSSVDMAITIGIYWLKVRQHTVLLGDIQNENKTIAQEILKQGGKVVVMLPYGMDYFKKESWKSQLDSGNLLVFSPFKDDAAQEKSGGFKNWNLHNSYCVAMSENIVLGECFAQYDEATKDYSGNIVSLARHCQRQERMFSLAPFKPGMFQGTIVLQTLFPENYSMLVPDIKEQLQKEIELAAKMVPLPEEVPPSQEEELEEEEIIENLVESGIVGAMSERGYTSKSQILHSLFPAGGYEVTPPITIEESGKKLTFVDPFASIISK